MNPLVWERDELMRGRNTRASPHLSPGLLGGTLWTGGQIHLLNLRTWHTQWEKGHQAMGLESLGQAWGEGWMQVLSPPPLPTTRLSSLLRGFCAPGWRDI